MIIADFSAACWRTSSHSTDASNCVQVATAPSWRTSSHSSDAANCVQVATGEHAVGVRDSKNPTGGQLTFTATQWHTFLR